MSDLNNIGYSDWFKNSVDEKLAAHGIARVVSVHKESYTITKGGDEVIGELSGNLLYSVEVTSDLPTTGYYKVTVLLDIRRSSYGKNL